jgi:hypothetical protein
LAAARAHNAYAAVFYLPDHPDDRPPNYESGLWNLEDGGRWRIDNTFPIYAISGAAGRDLTRRLAEYSDTLPNAPHGDELAPLYPPGTQLRVFGTFSLRMIFH